MDENLKSRSFDLLERRRWKNLLAVSLLLLPPVCVSASELGTNENTVAIQQQAKKTVTGTVLDETGQPVMGATVVEKGNPSNGSITDIEGKFTLRINQESKVSVSYVGYKSQDVTVVGNSVAVSMVQDSEALDEVVVVAYGVQKKKDLTGSMTSVRPENIQVQNTTTVTRALEGAAPGIQVAAVDGQPGFDMAVRIRGVSSTNGNSSAALIVIDGVAQQTNSEWENPLSQLDPNDIASISILKDAASTALYGSRGANGVVLITTKRGQSGKAKITFESRWGWNSIGNYNVNSIDNAATYYEYVWKSIYNSYRYGVNGTGLPGTDSQGFPYTNVKNPNHTDEEARLFASQHLFDYNNSETAFQMNVLRNNMAYDLPGAIYTNTGSGTQSSSTMSGEYLIDPATGRLNPAARLLYSDTAKDLLFKHAFRQEYNLSASGGTDKMHYYFSLGYQNEPSYLKYNDFRRYNGRANMDAQLFDWMKVGANIGYSNTKTHAQAGRWGPRQIGAASGNAIMYVKGWTPIVPLYQRDKEGKVMYDANGDAILNVANKSYSPFGAGNVAYSAWTRDFIYEAKTNQDRQDIALWTGRLFAEFSFLKYFKFNLNFNMDETNWRRTRYMNSIAGRGAPNGGIGILTYSRRIINTQQLLSYSQDFGKQHHVDAMVGHEYEDLDRKDVNFGAAYEMIPGYLIPGNFVSRYSNISAFPNPGWSLDKFRTESYLGRANYTYADRYYASASFRRDASSKFTKENRWGTFWSLGAGWRISSENFMANAKSWLDNLKLRASYGVTGNSNGLTSYYLNHTWNYGVAAWQSSTNGTGVPKTFVVNSGGLVRDDLTWENIHQVDIGVDFSLLNNRITGAIDYYNHLTTNSLYNQIVSPLANAGNETLIKNSAKLRNTGIEFELDADIIRTKDWTWSVGINGTHYRTILVKVPASQIPYWDETIDLPKGCWTANNEAMLTAGTGRVEGRGVFYLRGEGRDLFNLYMFKYAGVDQETGLPLYWHRVTYKDVTPDKETGEYGHNGRYKQYKQGEDVKTTAYSDASRYEVGSATPDFMGGITTSVRWRNIDLGIVAAYQLGGKFFSTEYGNNLYKGSDLVRQSMPPSNDLIGNTWTPDNAGAYFPMQWFQGDEESVGSLHYDGSSLGGYNYTDMALFDASYFRIKNVTLGYTLPQNLIRKIGISKLRAYVSADNVLLFSKKQGLDPTASTIGGMEVQDMSYPQMQTITIGLNIDF